MLLFYYLYGGGLSLKIKLNFYVNEGIGFIESIK